MGKTIEHDNSYHKAEKFDLGTNSGYSSIFDSRYGPPHLASLSIGPKRLGSLNQSYNGPVPDESIMSSFKKPKGKMSIHEKFNAQCLSPSQRHNELEFRGFKEDMDATYRTYQKQSTKVSPVKNRPKLDLDAESLRYRTSSQVHRQIFSEHSTMATTKAANLRRTDFLTDQFHKATGSTGHSTIRHENQEHHFRDSFFSEMATLRTSMNKSQH